MPTPNPAPNPPPHIRRFEPAHVVILGGVCAALHVGKLPPAIPALQEALGITLVQAGFLLSMVQLAGMSVGVAVGALADSLTPRRSMLIGLVVQAMAGAAGGFAPDVAVLMALRAAEGFGFLLVVLAAPALIRQLIAPERLNLMMGQWSAFMPVAIVLALLAGPWVLQAAGWRTWWWVLAAVSAAMALWLARAVPRAAGRTVSAAAAPAAPAPSLGTRLARTLSAPGPWLLSMSFAVYAAQWMAVIGFLPTIYAQAGTPLAAAGGLTAAAAVVNIVGNVGAGRLLHAGVPPVRLLRIGFAALGLGALFAFLAWPGAGPGLPPEPLLPAWLRFVAVLVFSGVGGLVPGTLFALVVRLAPGEGMVSTTVGWMQQGSALGQFGGPPLVAWVAAWAGGGWHLSWVATGACSLIGLALSVGLARHLRPKPEAAR